MKTKIYFTFLLFIFLFFIVGCSNYTVTFKDYDGSIIKEVIASDNIKLPENPIREGYTFIGWDHNLEKVEANLTVTALYEPNEYYLRFSDLNDLEIKVLYDSTVNELPSITKEGHTFIGWELNSELINLPFNYTYPHDLILTPKFSENTSYLVSFYGKNNELLYSENVLEECDAKAPLALDVEGYTFVGWDCEFKNVHNDLTVNAIYKAKTYLVSFSGIDNYHVGVTYDSSLSKFPIPNQEGSTFIGWELDGELISFPLKYVYPKNITLTPRFESFKYEVKFYNAFDELINTSIVDYGSNAIALEEPIKVGYEFLGWDKDLTNITNNLEVRPTYKPLEFFIYFDTVNIDPILIKYDNTVNLPILLKKYYVFEGWLIDGVEIPNSFKFNYLEDIHLTPKYRDDDYNEMMEFLAVVDNWLESANSLRMNNTVKIKERASSSNYLIKTNDITYIYPEYGYYENKLFINGELDSHTLIKEDELGTAYLYKITSRLGKTSIYTKEVISNPEDVINNDNIFNELSREMTYEKKGHNNYLVTSTLFHFSLLNDLVGNFSRYENEIVYIQLYFDEVNNILNIRLNTKLDFFLDYEMIIDEYNNVEMIDIDSNEYEQLGTYKNPEVINDISNKITKTQGLVGASTIYQHYYLVDLEEGYYLFDFETNKYDSIDTYYSIKLYNENGFGVALHPITNSMTVNGKRIFYVEAGTYKLLIEGKHIFGYSFSLKHLDYVSYSGFTNPQPIEDNISGVLEGIFDLNIYSIEIEELYKLLTITNIETPLTIVHINPDGKYNVYNNVQDIVGFEIRKGKNTIIITGSESTTYNLNIDITDEQTP